MAVPANLLLQLSDALADLAATVLPHVACLSVGDSTGSGFVVDDAGHVVTNFHVVEGRDPEVPIRAAIHGFATQTARVIGEDPLTDLAVLELADPHPGCLELRDAPARLGEMCMAVGSPLGVYTESVSTGIVSGLSRSVRHRTTRRPLERAIQTDCAINPGNSGGPLVDMAGRVIGVNTAVASDGQGIGFAVPAGTVRAVTAALIADGKVVRASLGVSVAARDVELDGRTVNRQVVTRTKAGRTGGLLPGDVLLAIDGVEVDGRAALFDHLTADRIGRPVVISVRREGVTSDVQVVAEELGS
jgi:S1-C subfamily serine protease